MSKTNDRTAFQIDWDLHELGPKAVPAYRDVSSQLDFSRLDYARAVSAGYLPANERHFPTDKAA